MDVAFASLDRGRKQGKNGRDRLMLTISGYVSQLIDELNCCVVLMEEHALQPDDRVKLVRQRDRFERALRALVKEGIEDGSVVPCDPKLAIFVILGAMNWVPKWFRPSGEWTPEQLTVALSQIFDRALSSTPAAAIAARRRRRAGLGESRRRFSPGKRVLTTRGRRALYKRKKTKVGGKP